MNNTLINTEDEKGEITEELYQAIQTIKRVCREHGDCNACPLKKEGQRCRVEDLPEIEVVIITKKGYKLKED